MRLTLQRAFFTLAIVLFAATIASAQTGNPLPSAEDVVAKMMQFDTQRQSRIDRIHRHSPLCRRQQEPPG